MPVPEAFFRDILYSFCNLLLSLRQPLRGEFAQCLLLLMSVCLMAIRDTFALILFWLSKIFEFIISALDIPTEADVASVVNDWQERWDPEEHLWIAGILQDILNVLRSYDTARARTAHQESPPPTPNETTTFSGGDGRSGTYRCYSFNSDSSSELSTASTVGNETEYLTHNRTCKREIARIIPRSDATFFERHVADALGQPMPEPSCDQRRDVQDLPETNVVEQTEAENPEFDLISFADSSDAEERRESTETGRSCYAMYEADSESDEELTEPVFETYPGIDVRSDDTADQDFEDEMIEYPSIVGSESPGTIGRSVSPDVDDPMSALEASEAIATENGKTTAPHTQQPDHKAAQPEIQESMQKSWNFGTKRSYIDLRWPMPSLPPKKRRKVKQEAGSDMALLQEVVALLLEDTEANEPRLVPAMPEQNTCIPFEPSLVPEGVPSQKIVARHHGDITEEFCSECRNLLSRDIIMDEASEPEKDDMVMIDIITCVDCTMMNTSQWEEVFIGVGISEEYVMVGTPQWDEHIAKTNPHNECVMTGTMEWDVMFRAWLDGIRLDSDADRLKQELEEESDGDDDDTDYDTDDDTDEENEEEEAEKKKGLNRLVQPVIKIQQPSRYDLREASQCNLTRQKLLASQVLKSAIPATSTKWPSQRPMQSIAMDQRHTRERSQGYVKILQTVKC